MSLRSANLPRSSMAGAFSVFGFEEQIFGAGEQVEKACGFVVVALSRHAVDTLPRGTDVAFHATRLFVLAYTPRRSMRRPAQQ
jgi:hypothetical protein